MRFESTIEHEEAELLIFREKSPSDYWLEGYSAAWYGRSQALPEGQANCEAYLAGYQAGSAARSRSDP